MKRVAINGLGRIGRAFLRLYLSEEKFQQEFDLVLINEVGELENMIYLLKYDSVYKNEVFKTIAAKIISAEEKYLSLESFEGKEREIRFTSYREPGEIINKKIWAKYGIDIVVECTGLFTSADLAHFHLEAGAKRVVISAPSRDQKNSIYHSETVLMSINEEKLKDSPITSNASCTTNAAAPIIKILDETLGVEKAILNTVHAYTSSQALVDRPNRQDWREGRAGAQNIVPSSTGAALAVTRALNHLAGKFDGLSIRVPSIVGSIVDLTFLTKRRTSIEEVNRILENASQEESWKGIFTFTKEELVSSDIHGSKYASIADLRMTKVVDGNLVKVLAWYDNEIGYAQTLLLHVSKVSKLV